MKVTVISIPENLEKGLEELEIIGKIDTVQIIVLLKSTGEES